MQVSQHRHMRFGGAICGLGAAYGVKGRGRPLGLWEKMEMLPLSVIPGKIFHNWKILEIPAVSLKSGRANHSIQLALKSLLPLQPFLCLVLDI